MRYLDCSQLSVPEITLSRLDCPLAATRPNGSTRGDDSEQRAGWMGLLCWLGALRLSKFQASLKAWGNRTPFLTDPKSASHHRGRGAVAGYLRETQKGRCAEAPVLPGAQFQEPRVQGGNLCWGVSSPGWEGSLLKGPARSFLGFLALSWGSCSPAPCTDPLVALSPLWELLVVVILRHCTLFPQRYSDLGLLFPSLASCHEGAVWRLGSLDARLRWWPGAQVLSERASLSGACPRAAAPPETGGRNSGLR